MPRPSFRVHFVTHHDDRCTGRLLPAAGGLDDAPSGYGTTEQEVLDQLALALEEHEDGLETFLWVDQLQTRKVKIAVHPQTIVDKRHVIAREKIQLELAYVWAELGRGGGVRVVVPRFGWWFVLEDIEMAPAVLRQAVSTAMLGEHARSIYDFRSLRDERVIEWSPTLARAKQGRLHLPAESSTPTLHAIAENLVERERRRRGRPIVGRVSVDALLPLLTRDRPRSVLLVGPPGAGKTTGVRALARALGRARKDRSKTAPALWSTSADRIVAGMSYLGQWEQRCLDLIDELSTEGDLLYVDRLAPLIAPRTGRSSIADMLQPALVAQEIALIAECTEAERERLATVAPTFVGQFHIVPIEPVTSGAMPGLLRDYIERTGDALSIDGPGLRRLVQHLEFFSRDSAFPGKGFRFVDWLVQQHTSQGESATTTPMSSAAISKAFARATGLPLELISQRHVAGIDTIASRLSEGVVGQDEACRTAARVLARFKAGLDDPDRPVGSLFFVGPTGVGKTELAKQLARYMFSDADRMIRLDMSELMLPGSAQRLLATGRGTSSLVERVRQSPLSLVLLDEIEKAHAEVFDLLLAMLGEGRMTDAEGRLVDFRMTIVVMTSNLGVAQQGATGFGTTDPSASELTRAVRAHFRPEFFNRIDHVVAFRNLSPEDILRVVDLEIDKASRRSGFASRGLTLHVDDEARRRLASAGWHPTRGARPLKRVIEERVMGPIAIRLSADRALRDRTLYVVGGDETRARRLRDLGEEVIEVDEPSSSSA